MANKLTTFSIIFSLLTMTFPTVAKSQNQIQDRFLTFTFQLYHRIQNAGLNTPQPIASSALFKKAGDLCYGLTMKHVTDINGDFTINLNSRDKNPQKDQTFIGKLDERSITILKPGIRGITDYENDSIVVFTFECDSSFAPANILPSNDNIFGQKGHLGGFVNGEIIVVPITFIKNSDGTPLQRYQTESDLVQIQMSGGPAVDSKFNIVAIHKGGADSTKQQNNRDLHGVLASTVAQKDGSTVILKLTEDISPLIPLETPSFKEKPILSDEVPAIYPDKVLVGGQRG
jgi:hypothetical protein